MRLRRHRIPVSIWLLSLLAACVHDESTSDSGDTPQLAEPSQEQGTINVLTQNSAGMSAERPSTEVNRNQTAQGESPVAGHHDRHEEDEPMGGTLVVGGGRAIGGAPDQHMMIPSAGHECGVDGGSIRPFEEGAGTRFGDVAGPFNLTMLNGEAWTFETHWNGCEAYVFMVYFPDLRLNRMGAWDGDLLWDSPLDELLLAGPSNTHYIFVSDESDESQRIARLEGMKTRVQEAIERLVPEQDVRQQWQKHLHLTTTRLTDIEGSVGEMVRNYLAFAFDPSNRVDLGDRGQAPAPLPYVFGIDRQQRFDAGGNLAPAVGQPKVWAMAAYLGHFYNHHAQVIDRLANEENITTINLLNNRVSDRIFTIPAILPDSMTMAAFDTMTFDISVNCPHLNPFACSEWDRLAHIYVCLDESCMERREIVRWITPYWRRGLRRWIMDATPFLGLVRAGAAQTFIIEMGPGWERKTERDVRIDLRFSTSDGPRSIGATRVFTGGGFNADYDTNHPPTTFEVPPNVDRIELVTIISGHGQEETNGCAEWCDHRHQFTINGDSLVPIASQMRPQSPRGCAQRTSEGVSPGQWGNWAQSRAFWCPGLPVEAQRIDITEQVNAGEVNEISYQTTLRFREPPPGGDIKLSAYIVWYLN